MNIFTRMSTELGDKNMIILCKECHEKNGDEIFKLIKNTHPLKSANDGTDMLCLQEEIRDLKQRLWNKSYELSNVYKRINDILYLKNSEDE
jgi:hypothetical protein